jgi:hypothetical protein
MRQIAPDKIITARDLCLLIDEFVDFAEDTDVDNGLRNFMLWFAKYKIRSFDDEQQLTGDKK